jgi:RNA-binding protein NOB1
MMKGIFYREGDVGSWMDPDWMPNAIVPGGGRKEKNTDGTMPVIGYGRRNPNERKRRK